MSQRMCDVCGIRPAVGTVRRVRAGQAPENLNLCEIHMAERRRGGFDFGGLGLFSDATRDLLQRAAERAVEWGSLDLDTDHLLHAALDDDVVSHVLQQAGADPGSIAAQIEEDAERGKPTGVAPSLSPEAKRTILAAYDEARELGSSYI